MVNLLACSICLVVKRSGRVYSPGLSIIVASVLPSTITGGFSIFLRRNSLRDVNFGMATVLSLVNSALIVQVRLNSNAQGKIISKCFCAVV
jgi:hypothetical protein